MDGMHQNSTKYLEDIKSKLVIDRATSLDDSELYRCLNECVGGHFLIPMAKHYRDSNLIDYNDIKTRINITIYD